MAEKIVCEWTPEGRAKRRLVVLESGHRVVLEEIPEQGGGWVTLNDSEVTSQDVYLAVVAVLRRRAPSFADELKRGRLAGVEIPEPLRTDDRFMRSLEAWVRARSEKGARVTKTVAERTFAMVDRFGILAVVLAMEKAADSGWTSIHPEKVSGRGAPETPQGTQNRIANIAKLRERN